MRPPSSDSLTPNRALIALIALLLMAGSAHAEKVVYQFQSGADGATPFARLLKWQGKLYGTTNQGGDFNQGTVFELTPPTMLGGAWTEQILYSFHLAVSGDAYSPVTGLVADKQGNLYGTTCGGNQFDLGTVYQLLRPIPPATNWTEKSIYLFRGNRGRVCPQNLIIGPKGQIYGTTLYGRFNMGAVFELSRKRNGTWKETILYGFNGTDGSSPLSVIADKAGNLFGVTLFGGSRNCDRGCGIVFELQPPTAKGAGWTEIVLYSFTGRNGDGAQPIGSLALDASGNLYGATSYGGTVIQGCGKYGCGTVFQLAAPAGGNWAESVIYSFSNQDDGRIPSAGLTIDAAGNLYGTASGGAIEPVCLHHCSVVFRLSPPGVSGSAWAETTLHEFGTGQFGADDAVGSEGGLIFGPFNVLYGTTSSGFGTSVNGTVFSVHP